MLKSIYFPLKVQARKTTATAVASTVRIKSRKAKSIVELDEKIRQQILNNELNPRRHTGSANQTAIHLPEWLHKATRDLVSENPTLSFENEILLFHRYLYNRQTPSYNALAQQKLADITRKLSSQIDFQEVSPANIEEIERNIKISAEKQLKQSIYNWQPIEYTYRRGLIYLIARGGHNYAVLYSIFSEIRKRDPSFVPKTLFDFGSGVGSVAWVTMTLWPKAITEYLGVEISEPMMSLSRKIIQNSDTPIKNIFFKQYFPIASPPYDLIVSAFSLLELPTRRNRLEVVMNLWKKTSNYLVIVEDGTSAGFAIVNEVRALFLRMIDSQKEKRIYEATIFAPCPNQLPCPMDETVNKICKFETSFFALPHWKIKKNHVLTTQYTYLVLKKGSDKLKEDEWPRLIEPVIKRSKQAICRMCTAEGRLEEVIFTKTKHEKPLFRCARSSKWGDRLPINISHDENTLETGDHSASSDEEFNSANDEDDYEPKDRK